MISICIPCKDDNESLDRAIKSIQYTATEDFEIVVCDDGSLEPIKKSDCVVIRHKDTIGVGAAIDTAVKHAKYNTIAISGSDIVHFDDAWMTKMCYRVSNNKKLILNSTTVGYKPDINEFASIKRYGAEMILKADVKDIPLSRRFAYPDDWRMLYRSKWNNEPKRELSTLLGGFYVMDKSWYHKLRGFSMHRHWGSLDSYLAMKSWLAGGSCELSNCITGHEFKISSNRRPMDWFFYNKVLVTRTLFPYAEKELLSWISDNASIEMGKNMVNSYLDDVNELTEYLQSIFIYDLDWYRNKFTLNK